MSAGRVLVTGAAGFVGQHLCAHLLAEGFDVVAAVRQEADAGRMPPSLAQRVKLAVIGDIGATTDWRDPLHGCDCVVHLAARAHVMKERPGDALEAFRAVNVAGALDLASQAKAAGVRRFVFLSSIGVNGDETIVAPFSEASTPEPRSSYALSKLEAELALHQALEHSDVALVVLRPPLVYGPGAPGNFARLIRLVRSVYVLPFASINNRRSFIYVGNLVDVIAQCIRHPAAAGQTFLVSDGQDVSTPDLMRLMARAMGCRRLFLPFPVKLMESLARLVGASGAVKRLIDSLEIDSRYVREQLEWTPPYSLQQGLRATLGDQPERGARR